jgi:hypothetical protein
MEDERQLNYRERAFVIMRFLGCPESIAKRMLTGARGEARTDVRRADECIEDFLQRTRPEKYARLQQRLADDGAYRHGLAMAKRIGKQVLRDIENDFR